MRAPAACLALCCLGLAQSGPPAAQQDALAARRTALLQAAPKLGAGDIANLRARVNGSPSDDAMVELGYAYFNANQKSEATDWWTQAATAGNSFGFVALATHAVTPAETRKDLMQAAALNDADAEWQYALMLLAGEGGPKLPQLGTLVMVDAATHGDLPALSQAGAAYLHMPGLPFATDTFPLDPARAQAFLDQASTLGLKAGYLDGLRYRRDAYALGLLKDPSPTHSLTDTNFMDYLREFRPAAQPAVIAKAQQGVDPKSAPWIHAQEERAWLTRGQDKALLLPLTNNDPQNLTVQYYNTLADEAGLPATPVFHDAASLALGKKVLQESQSGTARLNSGTAIWGLDPDEGAHRQAEARAAFEQGAALADAVAEGERWVNPNNNPESIALDYLDARGGLDRMLALQALHMTVLAHISKKLNDDNQKDVHREIFLAEDGAKLTDASLPNFRLDTEEALIASTQGGWLLRANDSAVSWQTNQPENKRDKALPATFGMLQAPAAGDFDDPLLEWARARKANTSWGTLTLASSGPMAGQTYSVYELDLAPEDANLPSYKAFITTGTYALVQLSFSFAKDADTVTTINYNYRDVGTLPGGIRYPTRCDVIFSGGASESDTIVEAQPNPPLSHDLFHLSKDDLKPLRDDLDAKAKLRKSQSGDR